MGLKKLKKSFKKTIKQFDPTKASGLINIATGGTLVAAGSAAKNLGIKNPLKASSNATDADNAYAQLIREKWEGFEDKDMPYILDYAKRITSGQDITDSITQATEGINRGFEISLANQQRTDAGLGVGLSDLQIQDREADNKRNQAAALVDAQNAAYTAGKDRQNALLAGTHLPNPNKK